ncbi:hypothetical protein SEPCBS119000_001161 [Sporothrix epigloea]|uniref:Protein required for cell viability n=1 Tax=Sporothrix epigloea TaxID=1892477 RepID=A0ABP0DAP9_9PEZI
MALLPALNVAIQPGRVPETVRAEFVNQLAILPLRDDGVRATLEFVFSVHPSSQQNSAAAAGAPISPQKQGAQITLEALKMATRLLANPPACAKAGDWFRGIAPQLLSLLDGHDGLELAKVAAYVIGFGILGRKSYGAPGAPGWISFAEPMLRSIDPTLSRFTFDSGPTVDLRENARAVLVPENSVAEGLRRLQTLIISHPNPGLTRRLLHPIILPLWALSTWVNASDKCEESYSLPARNLLKIYLKISSSPDKAMPIVRNVLFNGSRDSDKQPQWQYQAANYGQRNICIVTASVIPSNAEEDLQTRLSEIGLKSEALVDLLAEVSTDDDDMSSVFLDLLSRWLSTKQKRTTAKEFVIVVKEEDHEQASSYDSNPLVDVTEGLILQKLMANFPEKLVGRPGQILELVEGLLDQLDGASLAEDETAPVLLSLLNLVITSPGFQRAKANATTLQSIEESLARIGKANGTEAIEETAQTARNLSLFLKFSDQMDYSTSSQVETAAPSRRQIEDRKTYALAISYITQADSPPPVRSEGLNLFQGLILANSSVLDIPALLVMMSSMLGESEDYVNLRVIKIFTLLANKHPKSTTKELLDHYIDLSEIKQVDTRLRFGEALLQVIQRLGITFAGETAQQVGQTLLETAGRRAYRPKTEAKQAREQRVRQLKTNGKNLGANGNVQEDEQDIDMEDALLTDEERKRNEILGTIVRGWGSKQGTEDVRIRASALSILATCLDVNIAGLGATLASGAVDLSLQILTMESELEKGILRRAAIILILSFVRALHEARESGRRLGFGLTSESQKEISRILQYVAGTDEDGLVKQHALDVIESLEAWQLASLLPPASESASTMPASFGGFAGLAGLTLKPANVGTAAVTLSPSDTHRSSAAVRPRIEEVE